MRLLSTPLLASLGARLVLGDYVPTTQNPNAVNAQNACPGYQASSVTSSDTGVQATLTLAGNACNAYGSDVQVLNLKVQYQDQHRLSVNIEPKYLSSSNSSWFILPPSLVPKPSGSISSGSTDLQFDWGNDPSFWFSVKRKSTGDYLFNSKGSKLVFENQFIEFITSLPLGYNITGLGEHFRPLRNEPGYVSTLWNVDIADPMGPNLYGSHPFYLDMRYGKDSSGAIKGYSHGVFWRNAHGIEALYNQRNLVLRAIGGSVDLYFMDGPTPADVTRQYTSGVIGLPAMQQYWTLGYHQCHWGFQGWSDVAWNVDQFKQAGIPLETIWIDIDYMDGLRDFAVDPTKWAIMDGAQVLAQLHANDQHFVPIIDAGVWYGAGQDHVYSPYSRGHALDVFMKNPDGSEYAGKAWPGNVVFPDWQHPSAGSYWAEQLATMHNQLDYDGTWIDMNEPSSSCDGSCGNGGGGSSGGPRNVLNPPYAIANVKGDLSSGTMSTNAVHYGGMQEYDVHNLWGHQLINATYNGLRQINSKRPFIIGRSTFAGAGQWAGHWGGDNFAAWDNMAYSIPQALTMSLFGIPMFGVDTCGFFWTATSEMCGRWMQLSAFFPFYRNHYTWDSTPHEPFRWTDVTQYTKDAMKIRYALLPYMYTLFYYASTKGDTVMRAMAWEFPDNPAVTDSDRQFMLGPSIMVIPVITQGATSVNGFFPGPAPWYDWYTQSAVSSSWQNRNVSISAPQGHIPVYVRGGAVLPLQRPGMTTAQSRKNPWDVLVGLDQNGLASGSLYLDDGESQVVQDKKTVALQATQNSVSAKITGSYDLPGVVTPLSIVTIMGVRSFNGGTTFNGKAVNTAAYDPSSQRLTISGLDSLTSTGAWKADWLIQWK